MNPGGPPQPNGQISYYPPPRPTNVRILAAPRGTLIYFTCHNLYRRLEKHATTTIYSVSWRIEWALARHSPLDSILKAGYAISTNISDRRLLRKVSKCPISTSYASVTGLTCRLEAPNMPKFPSPIFVKIPILRRSEHLQGASKYSRKPSIASVMTIAPATLSGKHPMNGLAQV